MSCATAWSVTPCEGAGVNDEPHLPIYRVYKNMLIVLHKWYMKRQYIDLDIIDLDVIDLDVITPNSSSETNTLNVLTYFPKTQNLATLLK